MREFSSLQHCVSRLKSYGLLFPADWQVLMFRRIVVSSSSGSKNREVCFIEKMMKKRHITGTCCWQQLNTDGCKTGNALPNGRNNFAPFFVENFRLQLKCIYYCKLEIQVLISHSNSPSWFSSTLSATVGLNDEASSSSIPVMRLNL